LQQETWKKLVASAEVPSIESKEMPATSHFDGWLFIESSIEECMAKS